MLYFLTSILLLLQTTLGQDCSCSTTGVSNGVDTGVKGCRFASPAAVLPTCFVESKESCRRAQTSRAYKGASLVTCSFRDALLDAAEFDDVETIEVFRQRLVNLNITVQVPGKEGDRTLSLLAYAAAHGSFNVVEDLVINDDFFCGVGENVKRALCSLNGAEKCKEDNVQRRSVKQLLNHVYDEQCGSKKTRLDRSPVMQMSAKPSSRPAESKGTSKPSVIQARPKRKAKPFRGQKRPKSITRSTARGPASCGKHPYFVSVRSSFSGGYVHRCGGVLIYPDTVMTAAHCVDGSSGRFDPILLIESYSRQNGFGSLCRQKNEVRKGVKTVLHYKWSKGRFSRRVGNAFDVALIKLNKPSNKRPIKISTQKKPAFRETLQFVGFGRQSNGGAFSQLLQIQSLRTAKTSTCKKAYAPSGVDNNILCVGGSDKDFCDGDDGGPLIRRRSSGDELVGIAHLKHSSFGCGSKGIPGLYANAAKLKHWIKQERKKKF